MCPGSAGSLPVETRRGRPARAPGRVGYPRREHIRVIPILLDGIALAQLHTSTALRLSKALCGAVELWR